jgi:tRNA uridine 5-carboxymethylaminomethyl modification enzyme
MAGINAGRRAQARPGVTLRRDQAYIGVLIDDLVTKEMDEPYRMHTSQAEFRLLLRQDNAEERLSGLAFELGTIGEERWAELDRRRRQVREIVEQLHASWLTPSKGTNAKLEAMGIAPLAKAMPVADFLTRRDVTIRVLQELDLVPQNLVDEVAREAETTVKYAGYVERQESEVNRLRRLEEHEIPSALDYAAIQGLRSESREKLERVRPRTVGQAARIAGVAPSDVSLLLVHLERQRRQPARAW